MTNSNFDHIICSNYFISSYLTQIYNSFDVIDTATPLVLNEIKSQPFRRPFGVGGTPTTNAYHIADYGTADAGTSLGLMSKMVDAVRERSVKEDAKKYGNNKREVVLHYEDQLT